MSQADFGTIDPSTKSGSQLASDLNSWRTAVHSSHSGTSRPSYAVDGMFWLDTSVSPNQLKRFDGSDDIIVGYFDTTANTFRPATVFRGALAYRTAVQSIPNNSSTVVGFTSESYDTDSIHDNATNNTRMTVPSGVTQVRLSAQIEWDANATGARQIRLHKNGSAMVNPSFRVRDNVAVNAVHIQELMTPPISTTGGDYFEIFVLQTSGGALDINPNSSEGNVWFALSIMA